MAELEPKMPARRSWGGRNWWLAVLIVLIVAAVFLASVLTGLLGPPSERPEAVFLVGYPAEGEVLIPAWWSGRASWPAAWLYSDGLRDDAFMGRLKAAGVDVTVIEGTAPAAPISTPGVESAAAFRAEYRSAYGAPPGLYDASSYDAVFVLALAFQKAQTTETNSTTFKAALRTVANPPGAIVRPGMWAEAVENLSRGDDIDYQGASGAVDLDAMGDVTCDYEAWRVDATGNASQRVFIPQGSWTRGGPAPGPAAGDPGPSPLQTEIKIGTLLDLTGPLKDFGRRMQNATDLAARDIVADGGITIGGTPMALVLVHEDDGTDPARAAERADRLVSVDGVEAIVGATASSASLAVLPVVSRAGIIELSPSSTAPVLTTLDTTDQFWRTAPSDALQGGAAGWYAYAQRGWRAMSILYVDDEYGRGLSSAFRSEFVARGGRVLRMLPFPQDPVRIDADSLLTLLFSPVVPPGPQPVARDRRAEP